MSGKIDLSDLSGNVVSSKKYKSKKNRNEIIKHWTLIYSLNRKNNKFCLTIIPDEIEEKYVSGYVCISFSKFYERKFYRSVEHRNKIIDEFVNTHKLKKYFLEIIPHL